VSSVSSLSSYVSVFAQCTRRLTFIRYIGLFMISFPQCCRPCSGGPVSLTYIVKYVAHVLTKSIQQTTTLIAPYPHLRDNIITNTGKKNKHTHTHTHSEQLKKQEEMVERQEAMRRKTAEIEAELRTKTELAKTRAEAEGRIRQERENHDLILQKVRLEAVEQRDTVLKAIADGGKLLGEGLSSYLKDGEKLRNTAFIVSLAAAGIYSAKTAAGIAGRFIEVSRFRETMPNRFIFFFNHGFFVRSIDTFITRTVKKSKYFTRPRQGLASRVSFAKHLELPCRSS
jgi:hypothetical protein